MCKIGKALFLFVFLHANLLFSQHTFYDQLADSALTLTAQRVFYDPAYVQISYPNGDVAANKGVCTDVIIRAYRKLGIDLQQEVYEDMRAHFDEYPNKWGLKRPDTNIDHRRVANLMTFFKRYGTVKDNSRSASEYSPGDIVCWDLGGGTLHIGIVSNQRASHSGRYLIVHNIGNGQVAEDMLFDFRIIGHYTYGR